MSEWIKYSERKPEKSGRYLFTWDNVISIETYFSNEEDFYEVCMHGLIEGDYKGPGFYEYIDGWDAADEWHLIDYIPNDEICWMQRPELPDE